MISFDISADEDKLAQIEKENVVSQPEAKEDYVTNEHMNKQDDLLGIFDGPQGSDSQQSGIYGEFESSDSKNNATGGNHLHHLESFSYYQ